MNITIFLLVVTIFLLVALGAIVGWLLCEIWNAEPKDFDLNNVGNEENTHER
jgi:hypothetical protein